LPTSSRCERPARASGRHRAACRVPASPVDRNAQTRTCARRPCACGGGAEAVAQVVDEDLPTRFFGPLTATKRAGSFSPYALRRTAKSPWQSPSHDLCGSARPRGGPCRRWSSERLASRVPAGTHGSTERRS